MRLKGQVTTGKGEISQWMGKLKDFYHRKTGTLLFPGTLNILLEQDWSAPDDALRLEGADYGGSVPILLIPCLFEGRQAFIVRTDKSEAGDGHHPKTIIEIASDLNLRKIHRLKDDDWVNIEV